MYLRQLLEQVDTKTKTANLTSLKKELKDFLRTLKNSKDKQLWVYPSTTVAMLLYSYDPNWFVTTFNDRYSVIIYFVEESYPTSIPVDKIFIYSSVERLFKNERNIVLSVSAFILPTVLP